MSLLVTQVKDIPGFFSILWSLMGYNGLKVQIAVYTIPAEE